MGDECVVWIKVVVRMDWMSSNGSSAFTCLSAEDWDKSFWFGVIVFRATQNRRSLIRHSWIRHFSRSLFRRLLMSFI
jgi:hypothetical protein